MSVEHMRADQEILRLMLLETVRLVFDRKRAASLDSKVEKRLEFPRARMSCTANSNATTQGYR
jgi:hypothetical protein